jgi:general secretion pathway protein B
MSFILDALKKSEIERQRQSVPGLIDVPPASRRRRLPWWAVSLGVLLLVNVLVLSFLLIRGGRRPAAQAQAATTPPASTAAAASAAGALAAGAPAAGSPAAGTPVETPGADTPAAGTAARQDDRHFSPLDSAPTYAPEIPVQNDASSQSPGAAAVPRGLRHADPVLSDSEVAADNDEVLPSVNELNLSGQQALPELHLDVHVFGTKPSERFVYINMRKYHEGATLQEGPVLEHIRRDGAVLNFHGVRFLLPRQS